MKLFFSCPKWGSEVLSWDAFCQQVKDAGYDGVEAGISIDEADNADMQLALDKYDLPLIGQYYQSFEKDFEAHKASYKKHLYHIARFNPTKIDAQTGKDYYSLEQNSELFDIAFAFTQETGIAVAHETHRNKALYSAFATRHILQNIPSLCITADFSHWCNVSESFLEDQQEAIDLAAQHAVHIHARVGHTQGPQVTDPRLPEWQPALQHHLRWWQGIVDFQKKMGTEVFTITPEFGPAPYMPHVPHTLQPLANQWEINKWMMEYLKDNLIF